MTKHLKVSEARRHLFDLFEEVTANTRARVVIGHRDSDVEAVLLSRKELERLEGRARRSAARAFALAGSASLRVPAEAVLEGVRREQHALAERKRSLEPTGRSWQSKGSP